jgi:hypothetical protein
MIVLTERKRAVLYEDRIEVVNFSIHSLNRQDIAGRRMGTVARYGLSFYIIVDRNGRELRLPALLRYNAAKV